MNALERYKAYMTTCAAGGVLPCSYQAFAADQARACPTAEAGTPASIATGTLAQAQGHLMHLVAMIVDRDTPPDLNGDHVVDWDMIGKPITRRMVNDWAKAGREGGAKAPAGSAETRMDSGFGAGAEVGINSRKRAAEEANSEPPHPEIEANLLRKLAPAEMLVGEAASARVPQTPEEVVTFIGSHFNWQREAENLENVRYDLSVHDLLSAFRWWFDSDLAGAAARAVPPVAAAPRTVEDDARVIAAIWDDAKAEAAIYVEAHCVDGEAHAQIIMGQPRPEIKLAPVAQPLSAELADVLNTTLWLYRRLPQAYGNPPFVDQAILKMAERLGMDDVPTAIKERATLLASSSTKEGQ